VVVAADSDKENNRQGNEKQRNVPPQALHLSNDHQTRTELF
jgi:hypothetical protein